MTPETTGEGHRPPPASTILLLEAGEGVERAVEDQASRSELRVERVGGREELLEGVRAEPSSVAAVAIGTGVDDPLPLAQRVHSVDSDISLVLLADQDSKAELDRSLLFTPFLGEDITCLEAGDPEEAASEVARAAERRRRRRTMATATAAMSDQVGGGMAPPRIATHFTRLLEQMPLGVVTVDEEGAIHGWNRYARELLAGPDARAADHPLSLLFGDPSREAVERYVRDAVRSAGVRESRTFERLLAEDRTQFLELSAMPMEVAVGQPGAMVLVSDVTSREEARRERDRTEEELRQQRRWLEATLTSIGDAVMATDAQGRVTFMNGVAERLTGWSRGQANGLPSPRVFHIVDEATREPSASPVERALEEGVVVGLANHTLLLTRDGREVPIDDSGAPIRDGDGTVVGTVLVFRDISERRRAERALRASEERLRLILESLTDFAIFTLDGEGRVDGWSPGAREVLGWQEDEVLGRSAGIVFPEEDRRDKIPEREMEEALRSGRASDDRWHVRKDGSRFWASGVMAPLRGDGEERGGGFVKILRDQTEAKRSREQLEARARQQAAVARFGHEALTETNLNELLNEAARVVTRTLAVEHCKVLRLLPGGEELLVEAGVGWEPGTVGSRREDAGGGSQGGYTLQVGEPVVLTDLSEEERFTPPPLLEEHGVVAGMTVLIGGSGAAWGVLGAHTRSRRDFSTDDVHFLQAMANILAAAIQRQETEDELRALNETLERRVVERTADAERRAAQLQRMAAELTQAEQRERRRLADVLHDHLQQYLAAGWMQVSSLTDRTKDPDLRETLEKIQKLLDDSIQMSRNLTLELSPPVLKKGSLRDAFTWLTGWVKEQHDLAVELRVLDEVDPEDEQVRILVFQSVRELLFNAAKYSGVDRAELRLANVDERHFEVTVADRGQGFDPEALRSKETPGGFGLLSIRERLDILGGRMELNSAPGEGTTARLLVPMGRSHEPGKAETNGSGNADEAPGGG